MNTKLKFLNLKRKRILDKQVNDEIYNLPNLPSKDAPVETQSNNVQIKTWGDPLRQRILNHTGK